mgnify:FL=1
MDGEGQSSAQRKKKEPEEWEHGLFMNALPESEHPQSAVFDAMSTLIYDDKPEEVAENFKNQVSIPLGVRCT